MDSFGSPPTLLSLNQTRQKKETVLEKHHMINESRQKYAYNAPGIARATQSQIANLHQCISAYLDSIQMVCRTGSWLSQTFVYLLQDSTSCAVADIMKSKYAGMLKLSVSTSVEAKKKLGQVLLDFSLPGPTTSAKEFQENGYNNIKVLEKCMDCLFSVHNLFFKNELNTSLPIKQGDQSIKNDSMKKDTDKTGDKIPNIVPRSDLLSEWVKMKDIPENIKSWYALKQCSKSLRKYKGLTEIEIQNLLKGASTSSHPYSKKMNEKIDTALRSYEAGLRNLPWKSVNIFGGFYSSPAHARNTLKGCCSEIEIEQNIQRLPVSQFLLCELPLFPLKVENEEHPVGNSCSHTDNILQKKNAVRKIVQATNQKLSISETNDLTSEIVGEICPARWRTQTKACLQLLFGNPGLVIVDTIDQTCKNKPIAQVLQKDIFIVVTVSSLWSIKEDPGTMSLLQRHFDPEKTLATINVRYVCVYNTTSMAIGEQVKFEPGIFVEAFIYTGSKNRRWASQTLDSAQLISGMPATLMSICWLQRKHSLHDSLVSHARIIDETMPESLSCDEEDILNIPSKSVQPQNERFSYDKNIKRKIVLEIRSETESDEEKSSDNEHSVQDVIHLLSGCTKRVPNKVVKVEKDLHTVFNKNMRLENQVNISQRNGWQNCHHVLNAKHAKEAKNVSQTSSNLSCEDLAQQLCWSSCSITDAQQELETFYFNPQKEAYHEQLLNDTARKIGQQTWTDQVRYPSNSQSHLPCKVRESTAFLEQVDLPQAPQEIENMSVHYRNFKKMDSIHNTEQDIVMHGLNITKDKNLNQIQQNNSNNNPVSDHVSRIGHPPMLEAGLSERVHSEKLFNCSATENLLHSYNMKLECSSEHLSNQNSFEICKASRSFKNRMQSASLPHRLNFDKGPIRRPVLSKKTSDSVERSHSTATQVMESQGSNTWPFYSETMPPLKRDSEYEKYIAEITKNATTKKKPLMHIGYPSHTPQVCYGEELGHSCAVSDTPILIDHFKRTDTSDKVGQIMDGNVEQSRTWPPWQLWHSSGSWNNEILSAINRLEAGKEETW